MRRALSLIALGLALCCQPVVAQTQDTGHWRLDQRHGVTLSWGNNPQFGTDIRLTCQAGRLEVVYHRAFDWHNRRRPSRETGERVVWSSEGGRIALDMEPLVSSYYAGTALRASTMFTSAWQRLLSEGKSLMIQASSGVTEVPLTGAAEDVAALVQACGGP